MAKAPAAGKKGGTKVIFIKKKAKGHGHHGGAWKVAYADFVTAMMALFMVLWLVSQTDSASRSELSHYFRTGMFSGSGHVIGDGIPTSSVALDPGGGTPYMMESEQEFFENRAMDVRGALSEAIGDNPELQALRDQIDVQVTEAGLLIQIVDGGDDLIFDLSSSSLKAPLVAFLQHIGPVLGQIPNDIQLHGHTDARPFAARSTRSNWSLSFERADAARALLEQHGVRRGQIVGVLAHGDTALLDQDHPESARNRRLSILAVRRGSERATRNGTPAAAGDLPEVLSGSIPPPVAMPQAATRTLTSTAPAGEHTP